MKTFLIAAAAFLLAALLTTFLVRRSGVRWLPDGCELRLLGVSIGTNRFTSERASHRLARRILPLQYQWWIPQPVTGACGSTNGITIWFQQKLQTNQEFVFHYCRAETISDDGQTNRTEGTCSSSGFPVLRNAGIYLNNWPRRQNSFLLHIINTNQQRIARFRVPNPCRGPFPKWKPDSLPVTKTNGNLAVTFNGVYKFLEAFPPGKTSFWYRTDFDCAWQGVPTKEWQFTSCWLSDPTGNRIGALQPGLSTNEPVWRLEASFERTQDASFTEQERCVLATLPVLSSGSYTNFDIQTNFQGSSFWLWGWSGAATLTLRQGIITKGEPHQPTNAWFYSRVSEEWEHSKLGNPIIRCLNFIHPTLFMAHIPVSGRFERLYFRDDHGRLHHVSTFDSGILNDRFAVSNAYTAWFNHGLLVQCELPADTKYFTVEAIIQTPRWIDFYFEPPRKEKWAAR